MTMLYVSLVSILKTVTYVKTTQFDEIIHLMSKKYIVRITSFTQIVYKNGISYYYSKV